MHRELTDQQWQLVALHLLPPKRNHPAYSQDRPASSRTPDDSIRYATRWIVERTNA